MKRGKSAKDIAFENERAKFRKQIRELTNSLNDKQKQIDALNESAAEKDVLIAQQKEWIERLLEYTELSEEDMKRLIKKEKLTAQIVENMASMQRIFTRF